MLVYQVWFSHTNVQFTTNATPNTETDEFSFEAGARNVQLMSVQLIGEGAGLTAISGIALRFVKFGTASTGGTALPTNPTDPGMQAALTTVRYKPTSGSTRTDYHITGMGAAGPGGFVAELQDAALICQGGATNSIDALDVSGTASLGYEASAKFVE